MFTNPRPQTPNPEVKMSNIHIQVIMPNRVKLKEHIDSAILPGIEGDFEILESHSPFMTKLRPGMLKIVKDKEISYYAVHDGFVTVENDEILILSETCENQKEIDIKRATAAKERAEKRLSELSETDTNFRRAEIALKRAISRINTYNAT